MIRSKYLDNLIDSLTILPGVGRKSAERMAYQLLNINPQKSVHLSEQLKNIENKISRCLLCGIFLDQEEVNLQTDNSCHICERLNRDLSKICVTESTSDVYMINDSTSYNGYFFVIGFFGSNIDP